MLRSLTTAPFRANLSYKSHAHAVALNMMYYNFVRIYGKLRTSPALAAGLKGKLLEVADTVALVEAADAMPTKRGTYKSRLREVLYIE